MRNIILSLFLVLLSSLAVAKGTDDLPFSPAYQVGNILYLSGQVGLKANGKLVAGGVVPETHQVMENIKKVLSKYNVNLSNLVQCTAMLADMDDYQKFNVEYAKSFVKSSKYPARQAFAASGLAFGAKIELACIARLR